MLRIIRVVGLVWVVFVVGSGAWCVGLGVLRVLTNFVVECDIGDLVL